MVAYVRVSTDKQVKEGFGLNAQRSEIKRWSKEHGHRIVMWCADEGVSGANGIDTREGLYDALAAIRSKTADGMIITSLDRLARQMTQQEGVLADVWKHGGKMFSLGDGGEVLEDDPDDPMRTAIRQMRGVFAQLERGLIRQRMSKGKKEKARGGGYVGGAPPFGYESDHRGNLLPNEEMLRTIERIRALHADGLSLRQIISALNADGVKPRSGGPWYPATVSRIVARGTSTPASEAQDDAATDAVVARRPRRQRDATTRSPSLREVLRSLPIPTWQYFAEHGLDQTPEIAWIGAGEAQECHDNAWQLVLEDDSYTWWTGFALVGGIPIEHSWVERDGAHYEITLPFILADEYIGLPVSPDLDLADTSAVWAITKASS